MTVEELIRDLSLWKSKGFGDSVVIIKGLPFTKTKQLTAACVTLAKDVTGYNKKQAIRLEGVQE